MIDPKLQAVLEENGYIGAREIPGQGVCAVTYFAFTAGLCCHLDMTGMKYRYCFRNMAEAAPALLEWDGTGHPPGDWIKRKGDGGDIPNPALPPDPFAGA